MDDKVVDLSKVRFKIDDDPGNHELSTALKVAEDYIQEKSPDHVIIFFGKVEENGDVRVKYLQAGTFDFFGMVGLCVEGMEVLREG